MKPSIDEGDLTHRYSRWNKEREWKNKIRSNNKTNKYWREPEQERRLQITEVFLGEKASGWVEFEMVLHMRPVKKTSPFAVCQSVKAITDELGKEEGADYCYYVREHPV